MYVCVLCTCNTLPIEIKADLFVPTTDSGGRSRSWPALKSPPSKTKDSGVPRGSETRTGETGEEMVVFIPAVPRVHSPQWSTPQ